MFEVSYLSFIVDIEHILCQPASSSKELNLGTLESMIFAFDEYKQIAAFWKEFLFTIKFIFDLSIIFRASFRNNN